MVGYSSRKKHYSRQAMFYFTIANRLVEDKKDVANRKNTAIIFIA